MNIFKMEWKRGYKSLIIWTAVSAGFVVMMVLFYPSMLESDMMALMNAKLQTLPQEFIDMFHMSGEDFTKLPQFFGIVFNFMLMVGCIYGTIMGLSALTREESEGTIEFLYAKPVKRAHIVSMKLAATALIYLAYFAVIAVASIAAAAVVRPHDLAFMDMASAMKSILAGGALTGFAYFFLGFAVSVFLRKARHVASLASAIFFGTYVTGSVPAVTGLLEFLKWVSPMNYFVPKEVVLSGLQTLNVLICLGAMGVCAFIAYRAYARKDFVL